MFNMWNGHDRNLVNLVNLVPDAVGNIPYKTMCINLISYNAENILIVFAMGIMLPPCVIKLSGIL